MKTLVRGACALATLALATTAYAELSDVPSGEYGLDDHHAITGQVIVQ